MDIILVRHAEAVDRSDPTYPIDRERPLTAGGREQARQLARTLTAQGIAPDLLACSPLVRAVETAEELRLGWGIAKVLRCPSLAPKGRKKRVARFLQRHAPRCAVLIGHEPELGELAGWFLGSRRVALPFAKAGAALLRSPREPGKGSATLKWFISPLWFLTDRPTVQVLGPLEA